MANVSEEWKLTSGGGEGKSQGDRNYCLLLGPEGLNYGYFLPFPISGTMASVFAQAQMGTGTELLSFKTRLYPVIISDFNHFMCYCLLVCLFCFEAGNKQEWQGHGGLLHCSINPLWSENVLALLQVFGSWSTERWVVGDWKVLPCLCEFACCYAFHSMTNSIPWSFGTSSSLKLLIWHFVKEEKLD